MDYHNYSAKDFVMDEYFQRWVLRPDADTRSFWEDWLRHHPHQRSVVREARQLVSLLATDQPVLSFEEAYRIKENIDRQLSAPIERPKVASRRAYLKLAASWVGVIGLLALLYWALAEPWSQVTVTTQSGETREVVLPDGSHITLNANSRLRYIDNWDEEPQREVRLEGEAYFEVAPASLRSENSATLLRKKFIVRAGDANVVVLGTKFNVHYRRRQVQVVLTEGKVTVNARETNRLKEITMQPGERVVYQSDEQILTQQAVATELYTSWKENRLIFKSASLRTITQLLEDTYGYRVELVDPSLNDVLITATVAADRPDTLLKLLEKLLGAPVHRDGNTVRIGPPD